MEKRDARNKDWFWINSEYVDKYMSFLGVFTSSVYICLCRHADNTSQTCFPSMKLIAEKLGISTKSVERATKVLEECGFLLIDRSKKEDGTQANNIYTLLSQDNWHIPTDSDTIGTDRLPCTQPTDSDDVSRQTGVLHNYTHNNNTHLTILKDLPPWLNQEKWLEWIKYRKQVKKKMSPITIKKQINFLSQYKEDHMEIIEMSMSQGWTGLFPLKKGGPPTLNKGTPFSKGKYDNRKSEEIVINKK